MDSTILQPPGDYPDDWLRTDFDHFATLQRGKDLTRDHFRTGSVPVAGSNGIIGYHDAANVKAPGITVGRSGSVGEVTFYRQDFWAHNTALFVKDFHGNSPEFTALFLGFLRLGNFGSGASVPTLDRNVFRTLPIVIPPPCEQRQIAAVLGLVQRAIEQQERLIALTTELKKALLHKLFTEGLRGEPQKQTEIGCVPESWEVVTLASLFEIKHEYAFEGEFFVAQGRYVLLTPGHFFEEGGFRDQKDKTKCYVGEIPRSYLLAKGDLLLAMTEQKAGLLGSAIIVPESEKFLHNQRLGLIQNLDEQRLDKLFLFYFFNTATVRKQIFLTSSGSKVRHTSPNKIRELSIALPTLDEQNDIVQLLQAVDAKIEVAERKRQSITNLFRNLLHQLMTAQIRVDGLDLQYPHGLGKS